MFFNIIMIILGFGLLVLGADFLVKGSSNIAKKFHIPEMLIGLTIVALGTSAPELIITISSATSGANDLILGNAIGSNLCNLLFILGLMCVIRPVEIDKEAVKIHIPMAFISAIIIWCLSIGIFSTPNVLDMRDGLILIFLFILYFSYPIFTEIKDIKKAYKDNLKSDKFKHIKISASIFFIIVGIVLLKYGGDDTFTSYDYMKNPLTNEWETYKEWSQPNATNQGGLGIDTYIDSGAFGDTGWIHATGPKGSVNFSLLPETILSMKIAPESTTTVSAEYTHNTNPLGLGLSFTYQGVGVSVAPGVLQASIAATDVIWYTYVE